MRRNKCGWGTFPRTATGACGGRFENIRLLQLGSWAKTNWALKLFCFSRTMCYNRENRLKTIWELLYIWAGCRFWYEPTSPHSKLERTNPRFTAYSLSSEESVAGQVGDMLPEDGAPFPQKWLKQPLMRGYLLGWDLVQTVWRWLVDFFDLSFGWPTYITRCEPCGTWQAPPPLPAQDLHC